MILCPFIYSTGRRCKGHIIRMEAFKADLEWKLRSDGEWEFRAEPRSHYHLYCNLKNGHGGLDGNHPRMKFWSDELPKELEALL